MSIAVVTIERRYKYFDGEFYVQGIEDDDFFCRYLDTFDFVKIIARVETVTSPPENYKKFNNKKISFLPIFTTGTGVMEFASIWRILTLLESREHYLIIRTPGILAYLVSLICILRNKSFSLEVVTNPEQEARHSTNNKLINYALFIIFGFIFRMQLYFSNFVSFVTEHEIQDQYLKDNKKLSEKFNSSYSSITLPKELYATIESLEERSRRYDQCDDDIVLLFMGVLDRNFKGLDVFLKTIEKLPVNYKGIIVGDGLLLKEYKELASKLGIYERVFFTGYIDSPQMKKEIMDHSDIFILSSRREGLPRVVIEAMSNGLPCICTNVSGVKELISSSMIYPVDDSASAAVIILSLSKDKYKFHSNNNYVKALEFESSELQLKRNCFYFKVKNSESSSFK